MKRSRDLGILNKNHDFLNTQLPHDIIIYILRKVPAQTLIQSRCVCKYFNSIISHPRFIDLQLLTHNHRFFVSCNISEKHIYFHDSLTLSLRKELEQQFNEVKTVLINIVGSVKGLLCLLCLNRVTIAADFILWNPWIGRFITLPSSVHPPSEEPDSSPSMAYGFGFDHKSLDFKVVKMLYNYFSMKNMYNFCRKSDFEFKPHVFVYGLKTGSWRSVGQLALPCFKPNRWSSGVFASGVLHWLANKQHPKLDEQPDCILCFNLADEVFEKMDLPQLNSSPIRVILLGLGGKSLALFFKDSGENWSMWLMNDYANNVEFWTKKHDLLLPQGFVPMSILNDGKNIVAAKLHNSIVPAKDEYNLIWVDVEKNICNEISDCEIPPGFHPETHCVPSLARLDFGQQLIQ